MNLEGGPAVRSELLRVDEAALYLACSTSTLKRLVRSGCIPKTQISSRLVRYRLADLNAYVDHATDPVEGVPWPARTWVRVRR